MKSKLSDMSCLVKDKSLSPHIPSTRPLTKSWLKELLTHHAILYVKPDCSLKGIGVIRIDKKAKNEYLIRSQDTKKTVIRHSLSSAWETINRLKRKQSYIIQQGISSLSLTGNPFDVRIHLLRVDNTWKLGGMVAKLNKPKSIVTNGSAGAVATHIDDLLTSHLGCTQEQANTLKNQLEHVGLSAAKAMKLKNPRWYQYGLDVGIDANHHVWVYEINTLPGLTGFREIDLPSYRRIRSLRKQAS